MKIAIASGKGGTGKSTVSINLAYLLSKKYNICLKDCDVEEPNCHIFLKPNFGTSETIYTYIPKIDEEKCTKCGKCKDVCQFNAIAFIKDIPLLFDELCHGCESCKLNCKVGAIIDSKKEIGELKSANIDNFTFVQGKLKIGEAMSPPLIKAVKNYNQKKYDIEIFDCPPGTSCPMINAISNSDFVILVTEPTPFGFYDLKLAVDVVRKLNLPFGIVINRSDDNDKIIESWAKKENINILTKIPNSIKIMKAYSQGEIILKQLPEFKKYFEPLLNIIKKGK